jgi:hypothetical protein
MRTRAATNGARGLSNRMRGNSSDGGEMSKLNCLGTKWLMAAVCAVALAGLATAQNQVLGRVDITGTSKIDKSSGVWVDGQYVGFVKELKGNKKLLLLPGEHEIAIRQSGYIEQVQKVTVEPGQTTTISVHMEKDPKAEFPAGATAEVKLEVSPDRAAVFIDGAYVGSVREFSGIGRAMLVAPGKHQVKIGLPGYQDFTSEIVLRPNQKMTLKTDLIPGSITQAGAPIKNN